MSSALRMRLHCCPLLFFLSHALFRSILGLGVFFNPNVLPSLIAGASVGYVLCEILRSSKKVFSATSLRCSALTMARVFWNSQRCLRPTSPSTTTRDSWVMNFWYPTPYTHSTFVSRSQLIGYGFAWFGHFFFEKVC